MFPRLRHQLVSCWGNYAWDASVTFRPENHFIVASAVYRGRQVGDNNIQVNLTYKQDSLEPRPIISSTLNS